MISRSLQLGDQLAICRLPRIRDWRPENALPQLMPTPGRMDASALQLVGSKADQRPGHQDDQLQDAC